MSRNTSKSASAERRATSRRALFTVALTPCVPSATCAAVSAASSTSTVVRAIGIMLAHHDATRRVRRCHGRPHYEITSRIASE